MVLRQLIEWGWDRGKKDGSEEGWSLIAPLLPGSLKECYRQGYYNSQEEREDNK